MGDQLVIQRRKAPDHGGPHHRRHAFRRAIHPRSLTACRCRVNRAARRPCRAQPGNAAAYNRRTNRLRRAKTEPAIAAPGSSHMPSDGLVPWSSRYSIPRSRQTCAPPGLTDVVPIPSRNTSRFASPSRNATKDKGPRCGGHFHVSTEGSTEPLDRCLGTAHIWLVDQAATTYGGHRALGTGHTEQKYPRQERDGVATNAFRVGSQWSCASFLRRCHRLIWERLAPRSAALGLDDAGTTSTNESRKNRLHRQHRGGNRRNMDARHHVELTKEKKQAPSDGGLSLFTVVFLDLHVDPRGRPAPRRGATRAVR